MFFVDSYTVSAHSGLGLMKKFYLLSTLVLAILYGSTSYAQDYSNKGKDFWISYPEHINGTGSILGLYLTSDVNTTGSINDNGTLIPFTVTANNITVLFFGTGGGFAGSNSYIHLGNLQDGIKTGAAVHVISVLPIVVYAHIINSARSGATLSLPTNVWGKEYIVPSYANNGGSGTNQGYGELNVMASLPNTQVEITPSINSRNGARLAGVPYTITLANPGDVYQLQFPQNTDMSGTRVKSVAIGGGGCQPIAVVSASTWSAINCGSGNGGDNFYQQLFPYGAWGKKFFTTPLKKTASLSDHNVDIVRVFVKDITTSVRKTENGVTTILGGFNATKLCYEYTSEFPTYLEADKPIQVIEYITTQNCGNPVTQSDPEMITLSSVEQTINDITVYSAIRTAVPGNNSNVTVHYINVVMKTATTGTFRINGSPPGAAWQVIPGTSYSYLKQNIPIATPISRLKADSAFSAYAYGFGDVESYGYNAGTYVKDLTQGMILETEYGIDSVSSVCTYSPFRFKLYYPDSNLATPPVEIRFDSLRWDLTNRNIISPNNFPIVQIPPTIDSTNIRYGRQVNWYSIPGIYSFISPGFDTLILTAYRSTNEGCGTEQVYEFPIQITNPPSGNFTWTSNGCITQPVQFTETTPQAPKPTYRFWWDFGDPASGPANNSTLRNPAHTFMGGSGTYTVRYAAITTPGCLLDTISHQLTLDDPPVANFTASPAPYCIGVPITFTDNSTVQGGAIINQWTWNFGDGSPPVIANTNASQVHSYAAAGTYNVTLVVQTTTGCASLVFTLPVTILPDGTITLTSGPGTNNQTVCINTPITNITYAVGGSGTGGSVSGLPAGVTGSFAAGIITISGTPTVSGVFNYTVSTTGPCVTPSANGTITVTADGTVTLTSAIGTDNQTVCINTPITNITYAVGGSGTGGSVSGLPAGVTGSFAGGIITISGTPTVSGVFNYTVSTTGPCVTPSINGTITVTADGTITLTSGPGTNNQTVCINTSITNITYAVGGSGTGGSVSGLPAGVTGSFAAGIITISGTPTVSGVFNYTVSTTGPCVTPSANGTITVTADGTVTLTSAIGTDNQTVCINTPITNITYAVGGSGTGGSVSGLPAGVTGSFAGGIITISGTPTVSGVFNYTVNTTGPCVTPTATGTITVTADGTITLTSGPGTNNQTVCINTPITNITYAVGGSGTGGSVSGLPAGVTGSFAAGIITISGTPTVSGVFNYTVSTTGPCVTPSANGTITVTADGTVTLTSAIGTDNQTVCINTPITNITYAVGGSGTGGSVSGLPAGVTGSFAGGIITISGTPTVSGVFNYTVNTTGPCVTPTATGTITVTADGTITLTSGPGTNNQTVCINTPITNITYAVGGSGTGGSVSGLPAGVTGSFAAGIITISGTPTVSGVFNYTVSTTGPCVTPSANGTITVTGDGTITLTSAPGTNNQAVCLNSPITTITYSVGGTGTGGSVSGLPAGVTGSFAGGIITISGTPTISGTFNYTVTTTGPCVTPSATGTILVYPLPTANFTFTAPSCETRTISFTDISVANAGNITSWAWDFGDPASGPANTSNLQNPTHTFANSGTYNVTLVVTTNNGCVSINPSQQVVINARPLAGYIIPEVCLNDTYAQFTDTSKVALPDNIVAWDWNFGDPPSGVNNISTLQNPQHSYSATGAYNVRLIVTSNRGCRDTITQVLFVNGSFPVADFTVQNPTTLCANDSVAIAEASTVFPGTITKVEIYWDNVGQPAVFDTDNFPFSGKVYKHLYPNFQAPLTRVFTIRYRAYSGGVCVNDKLRNITVNAAPLVQFNNMPDACLDAVPFQITQASEIGGVPGTGVFSGPGITPGGIFNPASVGPGTFTLMYTFTSTAAGCVDTMSNSITVLDSASARFTYSALVCEKSAIDFNSTTSTIPAASGTIVGWTWNFGDPASGVLNTSTLQNPTHLFTGWGNYNVTLYVTTSNGCKSTVRTIPVYVNPQPKPNFSKPASSCLPNANVAFSNLSTIADGTQGTLNYLWNFGDPGSGVNNTSTQINPSHIYISTGPFTVNLQVTSAAGCVHDTTIILNTVHPQPLASFNVDKIDVCVGSSFTFNNTSNPLDGIITQYNWTMDDGNVKNIPTFSYTYSAVGTYNVSLFIFNSNGCRSTTATKTVYVNPYPVVDAGPDKFMLEGGQVTLTPVLVTNMPVSYTWTPNFHLSDPNIAYTIASPPYDYTYILTVTSDKGCSRTGDVFVKVLKAPAIPNIFSPNGDGIHDTWVIQYLDTYPGSTVDIYNRYGQHIYHSEGYTKPWDGTINGNPVPVGTYYYIVNPKNGRKIMSGYVDVIR